MQPLMPESEVRAELGDLEERIGQIVVASYELAKLRPQILGKPSVNGSILMIPGVTATKSIDPPEGGSQLSSY